MMNWFGVSPQPRLWWVLGVALSAGAVQLGCDESGIGSSQSPGITATPQSIGFPKLTVGENRDAIVEVRNTGQGALIISDIELNLNGSEDYQLYWNTSNDPATAFAGIDASGEDHFDYPFTIEGRESIFLILNYRASESDPERGNIVLHTNVAEAREFEIPVGSSEGAPEIAVSPGTYDFGRVPAFDPDLGEEPAGVDITITNIGQLDLTIDSLTLNGSAEFTPLIDGRDPRREDNEALRRDPDQDGSPGLGPSKSFVVRVTYAPLTQGPDAADLTIGSNDPLQPVVTVSLTANGATPCINVLPAAVEFPASLVNRDDSRPIRIESCGGGPLEISSIELSPDSDPEFALDETSLPSFPAVLPAATPETAPPSREIRVGFNPREERVYHGKLLIHTNDPSAEVKVVSLLGRGVLNACPQARANPEEYYVPPLEVVLLDGSASVDPDGPNNRPVKYEWVVVDRPEGSVSQPYETLVPDDPTVGEPDDLESPTAVFFVDQAGTYSIELRVKDNLDLSSESCETSAVVTIVAKPEEAIHVSVTWTTPEDPDQTDRQGTDVDLHLRHPLAEGWFLSPGDCYYGNPAPDWGILGDTTDDPVLDIDDINGAGPENINLNLPENTETLGSPYLLGVHYYKSHERVTGMDYGASTAMVRVYLNGALNLTVENIELPVEDNFCQVAAIEWPAATATELLECYDVRP